MPGVDVFESVMKNLRRLRHSALRITPLRMIQRAGTARDFKTAKFSALPDVVLTIAAGEFDFEAEQFAQAFGLQDFFLASVGHDAAV